MFGPTAMNLQYICERHFFMIDKMINESTEIVHVLIFIYKLWTYSGKAVKTTYLSTEESV